MTNLEIAKQYCIDVITNTIPACKYIKEAAIQFIENLNRLDLSFDEFEVNRRIKFINCLNLSEQIKPTKFILQP